jgi:hypothetical protein
MFVKSELLAEAGLGIIEYYQTSRYTDLLFIKVSQPADWGIEVSIDRAWCEGLLQVTSSQTSILWGYT